MPDDFERITQVPTLPLRPEIGHKGMFGRVLVVGGSDGMIGAPVMAGTSALRMGAGLVQIAVPRSILHVALSITPELIGLGLGKASSKAELLAAAEKADCIVVGPGLGQSPDARARVMQLIRVARPMVIDADALNTLAAQKRWPATSFKARAVLTPHPGEMKRLAKLIGRDHVPADDEGRIALALEASRAFGQIIVLKGHRTVIADGRRVYLNTTGDSSLSKAGTGDVLCGVVACLLAQEMNPFDAAVAGAHLHGRAGELAGQQLGRRCVLAHDVIASLPQAIRELE